MFKKVNLEKGENIALVSFELEEGTILTKELETQAFKKYQELENTRGWIISEMNNIELFIERIIINSYFNFSQNIERELFKENILKQRFCTLMDKRKILGGIQKSELFKDKFSLTNKELSAYRGSLQNLIEIRNEFGHNQIAIQIPDMIGVLKCSKDGKERNKELSEEYLTNLRALHSEVLRITLTLMNETIEIQKNT